VPPPSHLTSCTPSKSNLYFDSSFDNVTSEPAQYKLLTFHVSSRMSLFRRLCRLSKESVQVRGSCLRFVTGLFLWLGVVSPTPNPSSRTTSCRFLAAAYSTYSQLPSTDRDRPCICILRTLNTVLTGTHLIGKRASNKTNSLKSDLHATLHTISTKKALESIVGVFITEDLNIAVNHSQ
jgi:hypothetical protein